MDQWWSDTNRRKLKLHSKAAVPMPLRPKQILHGLNMESNLTLCGKKLVTNCLSHGKAE
jgi:hypothetical protein